MAVKSRYMGYMKRMQKISQGEESVTEKTSSRESVLDRLKSLKGKEFNMTIPVKENADA